MTFRSAGRRLQALMVGVLCAILIPGLVHADAGHGDPGIKIPTPEEAARVNDNTVGVVFTHEELYHQIVHNMEDELETIDGLRIVPIMGKNHVQSIYDLLYLKGIDLALVRSDAMEYVNLKTPNINVKRVVNSVVKISEEKIIILARDEIKSVEDLAGKKVSLGLAGSGEYVTGTLVMDWLDVQTDAVTMPNTQAAASLAKGELDAMIYLLKAPDAVLSKADQADSDSIMALKATDGIHVLTIKPHAELARLYQRSSVSHDDLPGIVAKGKTIASYEVDTMLAAYKWRQDNPRYEKVERFVDTFMESLEGLKTGPYQPVWKRVSMEIEVPNTKRLGIVVRKMEDKQVAIQRAKEQEIIAQREAILDDLLKQEAELKRKLGEKVSSSDSAELKKLLAELTAFMDKLGHNSTVAE